jgi:hypothetical protein
MLKGVNWIAVVIAVIVLEALGFVWYGPLFGKAWIAAMGHAPEMSGNQNMLMGLGVVNTLVCVTGLAWLINRVGATTLTSAVIAAVTAWFFFSLTTQALEYLYMGMSLQLLQINAAFQLVSFLVAGALLNLVKFGAPAQAAAA